MRQRLVVISFALEADRRGTIFVPRRFVLAN